ncbi:MAG: hypothetical protein LOD92_07510, partial [Bacillales bacterium]
MTSQKVIGLPDAVKTFIRPDITLHFSFTHNRPMAFAYEMIRQFRRQKLNLELVGTGFLEYAAVLIAAGYVRKLTGAFVGQTYPRPKPYKMVQQMLREGQLEIEWWTNLTMCQRFMAAAYGFPMIPTQSLKGSSLFDDLHRRGKAFIVNRHEKDVVLIDGARTPFGKFGGSFKDISAIDLGAYSAKEAIARAGLDPSEIDEVVMGNVQQSSTDAHYLARHVGLKAGLPVHVPSLTVNRLCGSGLEAIVTAAKNIMLGETEVALAGGTENMSQIPYFVIGARWGTKLGTPPKMADYLWDGLYDPVGGCTMAMTAENAAEKYNVSREECDEFAKLSYDRAIRAMKSGRFAKEIVPVTVRTRNGEKVVSEDEGPIPTELEVLRKM